MISNTRYVLRFNSCKNISYTNSIRFLSIKHKLKFNEKKPDNKITPFGWCLLVCNDYYSY